MRLITILHIIALGLGILVYFFAKEPGLVLISFTCGFIEAEVLLTLKSLNL